MPGLLPEAGWGWLPHMALLVLALALGLWLGTAWARTARQVAPALPDARHPEDWYPEDWRDVVAAFATSPVAVALWDTEGRLMGGNASFDSHFPGAPTPPTPGEVALPGGRRVLASEARLPGGVRLGLYAEVMALRPPPVPFMPSPAPLPLPAGRLRLLAVDDSPANLSVLRALLSNTGFALETVTDGGAALDALLGASRAGTPFDAVLMDVMMPGMDGMECARRIRALPGPPGQVPVIPVTASSFPEDIAACHAAGMAGHVPKPVERVGLMRGIALALRCGDQPEEEALRPLLLGELANRLRELEAALAEDRPLLAPVHAIAGTVAHLGGTALVDEARQVMRALREADPAAETRVAALLGQLRAAYPLG